jgi:tripartite-type tricarboxylate transporter receptor subunit TctC
MNYTHSRRTFAITVVLSCLAALAPPAAGQSAYPDRTIRMVVGFAAGGAADLIARVVATDLAERLGKPLIVENRPGAGSQVAAVAVARAEPDGYTLFFGSISLSVQMAVDPAMQLNPLTELAPIALVAEAPNVLVVNPQLPIRSVKELVAYVKAGNPVNFASSGVGTTLHLAGEMLKGAAGVNLTHVPYKGSGPALNDLMGGQVQMMFDNLSTAMPLIRAGKLRPLAVTTRSRTPLLPDVPTMVEVGFENFEASVWFGVFAPRNTPRPIVDRLAREVAVMLADPRTPPKLAPLSMDVMKSDSPEKFAEFFRQDAERWKKVVAAAGVKLDKN